MRVVWAAHTNATTPLPVGSVHLAAEMTRMGHDVVYLAPPMSPAHLIRLRDPRLRSRITRSRVQCDGGFTQLTQWAVAPARALAARPSLGGAHLRWRWPSLRSALRELGSFPVDLLVIDFPYALGLTETLKPAASIYRATDVFPDLLDDPRVVQLEREILAGVGAAVGTSRPVVNHLSSLGSGVEVHLVPNGAGHSSAGRARNRSSRSRVIYAGVIDGRLDLGLLVRMARARPSVEFLLAGGTVTSSVLADLPPNLRALGWVPHEALLDLLNTCHVGVLPLSDAAGNGGRSPIKLFEYLCAGLNVVARRTEEIERLGLPRVRIHGPDLASALAALDEALAEERPEPEELASIRADLSWAGRAEQLLRIVDGVRS